MIEAALDGEGVARAENYIAELERSRRKKDKERLADIAIRFEAYCHLGVLQVPRELNQLDDEIWELKVGTTRLPFFALSGSPSSAVRVTHGFEKATDRTPRREITTAQWIKREDLKR